MFKLNHILQLQQQMGSQNGDETGNKIEHTNESATYASNKMIFIYIVLLH